MSVTLTVTNLTSATVALTELYTEVGPSGSANASITTTRAVSDLDRMVALKTLLSAGTVSVDLVNSSDNAGVLSVAAAQYGDVSGLSVNAVAVVTQAVTFPDAFDSTAHPNVSLTVVQNSLATTFKANAYARSITNTGFTAVLDVTTDQAGTETGEAQTPSPAPNGTLLGPFTMTVAHPPITSAAITVHWTESTTAKSATITGTSTIGGSNAANLSSASLNRTTGVLVLTFATGHPPDASSVTIDYVQSLSADIHWVARY